MDKLIGFATLYRLTRFMVHFKQLQTFAVVPWIFQVCKGNHFVVLGGVSLEKQETGVL